MDKIEKMPEGEISTSSEWFVSPAPEDEPSRLSGFIFFSALRNSDFFGHCVWLGSYLGIGFAVAFFLFNRDFLDGRRFFQKRITF